MFNTDDLINEQDVYIVDKGFNWTYIQTHETGWCGPYFSIKSKSSYSTKWQLSTVSSTKRLIECTFYLCVHVCQDKWFGGHRFFNPEFVKMIREKTNLYSRTYKKVNIYSTTNTNHNEAIITKCFKNGNRTGFKNITVYQANREDFSFTEEHKVL